MSDIKYGTILVGINGAWKPLRPNQVTAYYDCVKNFRQKGPTPNLNYDCEISGKDNNGKKYRFCIKLGEKETFFIQLGDGFYHELLVIHQPLLDLDKPKGSNIWQKSDSFTRSVEFLSKWLY